MISKVKHAARLTAWPFIKLILLILVFFTKYKVTIWRVDRLGHLALNTHLFLVRRNIGIENKNILILSPSKLSNHIANKTLWSMFVKRFQSEDGLKLYCSDLLFNLASFYKEELQKLDLYFNMSMNSREKEFALGIDTIVFDSEQEERGRKLIESMSLPENHGIVSVFARDSSFLEVEFPDIDWSYHSYRDCDINTYIDAIKFLIRKKFVVVRLGSEYSKPLDFQDRYYFEYSLSDFKSDFLDMYLIYKSKFVIGSTSGATDPAVVFNTPFAGVNYAPFVESPLGKNDIFIQKKLVNDKGVLPFKDVVSDKRYYSYNGNELRKELGVSYKDNTREEILSLTIEMFNNINNKGLTLDQKNLLREYHSVYCKKNKWSDRQAPISVNWLKENKGLYL